MPSFCQFCSMFISMKWNAGYVITFVLYISLYSAQNVMGFGMLDICMPIQGKRLRQCLDCNVSLNRKPTVSANEESERRNTDTRYKVVIELIRSASSQRNYRDFAGTLTRAPTPSLFLARRLHHTHGQWDLVFLGSHSPSNDPMHLPCCVILQVTGGF